MSNRGFKIGDKVKLRNPERFSLDAAILTIVRFEQKFIKVTWGGVKGREFPLYPDEIEVVVEVGEQLTFNFMND